MKNKGAGQIHELLQGFKKIHSSRQQHKQSILHTDLGLTSSEYKTQNDTDMFARAEGDVATHNAQSDKKASKFG